VTEFKVIIGKGVKKNKDLEISEAIEIMQSIKSLFYNNSIGKKTAYSLRFGDLIEGSSDLRFYVDTDNEDNILNIIPSRDLSNMCLDDFKKIKSTPDMIIADSKKSIAMRKFFALSRKLSYDILVQVDDDTDNCVSFSQNESIGIFDKFTKDKNIKTCLCSARVVAIDIMAKNIKLEVIKGKELVAGTIIQLKINQLIVDYCIKHHIQIAEIVSATTEVVENKKSNKYRLLNIYTDKIKGISLYD